MKKFTYIALLALIMSVSAKGQEFRAFALGPFMGYKAGLNAGEVMEGRKNGIAFANIPDFGASGIILLSEEYDLGAVVKLGLSNYAYQIKGVNVNKTYSMRYNYIALGASVYFTGFTMGFNFAYPVAGTFGSDISTDKLGFMTEFELGYIYPLLIDETGSLNFHINAGLMLSGIYNDYIKNDPLLPFIPEVPPYNISSKYNHKAVSLSIGISYWFNLTE